MYCCPASAHSSQGRAYTVGGKNDTVPMPKLPGNANQTPTRDQDQIFTALVDWVEKGNAPGRDAADVARQQHQLSDLRLPAQHHMGRPRTGDAGVEFLLQVG